ncbi:MAG: aminopeptidase N [Rhodospirillaceae bacterium]|nr:aminopeptidase N [Rhodospirillaceae bacterium]
MKTETPPRTIRLADYAPPPYRAPEITLAFDLHPTATRVVAETVYVADHDRAKGVQPLVLDGEKMRLVSAALDGRPLSEGRDYVLTDATLTLPAPPARFALRIETEVDPQSNTALEGLYLSRGKFTTQCEAEGFRRITYFQDRPDVMSSFRVTVRADKAQCPVLLSNGNPIEHGDLPNGRHSAVWHDPFPKPCYLFALVAGDLGHIEDRFTTRSGRNVRLRIYVEHGKEPRALYAMDALKRAMKWDEDRYGREYDLDVFNIVAVSDFNMGAMENKGLNIFNDKYILADPDTATDGDYEFIEAVVAHEYFHNWTGDRVTCRDWFQLSLKEGLTVFRDQQFSEDMRDAAVKRIEDADTLRARQFTEDASPLAHPVRPDSYIEINNFYTATVYEKGAEVIRMQHTLLGPENFRKGMDLYFARHDGQAVTCDDFVAAMEDASGRDLDQFKLWYRQAGTPVIEASGAYDAAAQTYALTLKQSLAPTPGQPTKLPMHIPFAVGLVGPDGRDIALDLKNAPSPPRSARLPLPERERVGVRGAATTLVLELRAATETFVFENVPAAPLPSLNRGFSAPVNVNIAMSDADRAFLMAHDFDSFNRWQAKQDYAAAVILRGVAALQIGRSFVIEAEFLNAVGAVIGDDRLNDATRGLLMTLPGFDDLANRMTVEDPLRLHAAREAVKRAIAEKHFDALKRLYDSRRANAPFAPDAEGAGRRALKNAALDYLAQVETPETLAPVKAQFDGADNMTDRMAALSILADSAGLERTEALATFARRYDGDAVVLDKWLSVQAASTLPGTLAAVRALMGHRTYDAKNPNRIRALIGTFSLRNPVHFHAADGSGYDFLSEQIVAIDAFNPQTAARLVAPLGRWRRFDAPRQAKMKGALERIAQHPGLSRDVFELASKSLAG